MADELRGTLAGALVDMMRIREGKDIPLLGGRHSYNPGYNNASILPFGQNGKSGGQIRDGIKEARLCKGKTW